MESRLRMLLVLAGRHHRDDLDQWDHDLERDDWFADAEWLVVKVFARGIYVDPEHAKPMRRAGAA